MRLTVSMIIGTIALAAILGYIVNPCLFPSKMIVTVDPMYNTTIPGLNYTVFNFTVNVVDQKSYPITDAIVVIKGLNGVGSNYTNINGRSIIKINVSLKPGQNEVYLDLLVKSPCFETFDQNDHIKIIRGVK